MKNLNGKEKPATQYFNSIDGLRLLASVNIVLFHLERLGGLHELQSNPVWFFRIIKGPAFHASLFFILAGFIFTVKYAPLAATFSTRALLCARLRDLYPLHALTTALMIPFVILPCIAPSCVDWAKLIFSAVIHFGCAWSVFPFFTYNLNTPSWALSAFFLCYIAFGPLLRRIAVLSSRRVVVALMACCCMPPVLWGLFYARLGAPAHLYQFFHAFAPIRLFEFVLGMLLARLYHLNNSKPRKMQVQDIPALNDAIILAALIALYAGLMMRAEAGELMRWQLYHAFPLPLYAVVLYRLARGNGLCARLFATRLIRSLGKCGFYPYLVHIPLVSWICWISEHAFGYRRFLHSPLNVAAFMIVLYGGSYLYWMHARKKRGKTYRDG